MNFTVGTMPPPKCVPPRALAKSTIKRKEQRLLLEVGHTYEPRYWQSGRAVPEDWRVWVRVVAGADISALVDRVVFELRPDTRFPYPKRIYLDAPYEHVDAGCAPDEVVITIHLKCSRKPQKFEVKYGPIYEKAKESSSSSMSVFYDVEKPTKELISLKITTQSTAVAEQRSVSKPNPKKGHVTSIRPGYSSGYRNATQININHLKKNM